jgi:hypothetical protein
MFRPHASTANVSTALSRALSLPERLICAGGACGLFLHANPNSRIKSHVQAASLKALLSTVSTLCCAHLLSRLRCASRSLRVGIVVGFMAGLGSLSMCPFCFFCPKSAPLTTPND